MCASHDGKSPALSSPAAQLVADVAQQGLDLADGKDQPHRECDRYDPADQHENPEEARFERLHATSSRIVEERFTDRGDGSPGNQVRGQEGRSGRYGPRWDARETTRDKATRTVLCRRSALTSVGADLD